MKSSLFALAMTVSVAAAFAAPAYAATHVTSVGHINSMTNITATPGDGTNFGSVSVFPVEGASNVGVGYTPNLRWNSDQRVVRAIQQAGYSGSTILGYHAHGSSLTVYVRG